MGKKVQRLYRKLQPLGWSQDDCELITPTALEINTLKRQQHAIILAHSCPTPDIARRAKASLDRMFELEREGRAILAKRGTGALPWTASGKD